LAWDRRIFRRGPRPCGSVDPPRAGRPPGARGNRPPLRGRGARAARSEPPAHLTSALIALGQGLPAGTAEEIASGALGDVRARDQALGKIERYLSTHGSGMSGVAPYGLIRLGRPREGLEVLARNLTGNDALVLPLFWTPYGREVRTLPEFPEAARRIGLVEFWDHHGPPDMCRRVEPGRYVCQ